MPVRKGTHYVGQVCLRLSVRVLTSVITQEDAVSRNNNDDLIEPLSPLTPHRYPTRKHPKSAATTTFLFPGSGLSMDVSSPGPEKQRGEPGVHLSFSKMSQSAKSLPTRVKAEEPRADTKRGAKGGKEPVMSNFPAKNTVPEASHKGGRRSKPVDLVQKLIARLPEDAHIVSFMSPFACCAAMCQTKRTTLI